MAAPLAAASPLPELSPNVAIHQFLQDLKRPQRLLIAVSGGSDSLGLLLSLKSALDAHSFPHTHSLVAATVDHGLRPAAAEEAQQVSAICEALKIPHRVMRWTGEKPQTGLSAAARLARYGLLSDAAKSLGADAIVTGHTLDDQIETVAMRAKRSADDGLGMAGMAAATLHARKHWILRPFLKTRRKQIREMLQAMGQTWIDDPSNEDPRFERVRTRNTLPAIDKAAIEEAGRRRQALSHHAAAWLNAHATATQGPVISIALVDQGTGTQEIRDHALSTLLAIIGGKEHRPPARSFARLTQALALGSDFRLTLAGTLTLRRKDSLVLARERRGFLPLLVAPLESGIWDGRYAIVNDSDKALTITAGPAPAIGPELPGAIRAALTANAPQAIDCNGNSGNSLQHVRITPILSLFADFMPGFDQPLADVIADLIGAERSPLSPI